MRICYYALRDVKVLDDVRVAGDLIPEAAAWPFLAGYIRDGYVAPVLVATLPQSVQDVLLEWEADQSAPKDPTPAPAEASTTTGDQPATTTPKAKQKERVTA